MVPSLKFPVAVNCTAVPLAIEGKVLPGAVVTTTPAVVVTPANPVVLKGTSLQMIATIFFKDGTTEDYTQFVSWTSSNTAVAHILSKSHVTSKVEPGSGTLTALQPGATTITAQYLLTKIKNSTRVTITP